MKTSQKGFTLIELLVVIAIIAILAAILFPVFARAREKARQTTCMTNQRQIMASAQMYAQDHEETMPSFTTFWQDINVDSNILVCPTAGKSLTNGYLYNFKSSAKALGEVVDPTTFWVTCDREANNIISTRHSGKTIVSYLDGHTSIFAQMTFPGILNFDFNGYDTSNGDVGPGGTMTGAAVIGKAGDFWNSVTVKTNTLTGLQFSGLKLATGGTSPATLSVSPSGLGGQISGDLIDAAHSTGTALLDDYIFTSTSGSVGCNTLMFSIGGLAADKPADLYVYTTAGNWAGNGAAVTVGSSTKSANGGWSSAYVDGTNYVKFLGLSGDTVSGSLTNRAGIPNGLFNGFQLSGTFNVDMIQKDVVNLDINGYCQVAPQTDPAPGATETYAGAAIVGNSGDYWNTLVAKAQSTGTLGLKGLKLIDGKTSTTVGFNVSVNQNGATGTASCPDPSKFMADWIRPSESSNNYGNALLQDYLDIDSTTSAVTWNFTIDGLVPNYAYNLYMFCQPGGYGGHVTKITANGTAKTGSSPGGTTLVDGGNYVTFSGLSADDAGKISGTISTNTGKYAILNGFQLVGPMITTP